MGVAPPVSPGPGDNGLVRLASGLDGTCMVCPRSSGCGKSYLPLPAEEVQELVEAMFTDVAMQLKANAEASDRTR